MSTILQPEGRHAAAAGGTTGGVDPRPRVRAISRVDELVGKGSTCIPASTSSASKETGMQSLDSA